MIIRRMAEAVRAQNWFTVIVEIFIVVLGVFIGIQVSNWNEERADKAREIVLLEAVRDEISETILQTKVRSEAYVQVGQAGARALNFLEEGKPCTQNCWSILVDFFTASQWQQIGIDLPTYQEMRRNGWPRNRAIAVLVDTYKRQADQNAQPLSFPPEYRDLVRGFFPLVIQRHYWKNCFSLVNGEETYSDECNEPVAPEVSLNTVNTIAAQPDIQRTLTAWAGFAASYDESLSDMIVAGQRALKKIDQELEARQ